MAAACTSVRSARAARAFDLNFDCAQHGTSPIDTGSGHRRVLSVSRRSSVHRTRCLCPIMHVLSLIRLERVIMVIRMLLDSCYGSGGYSVWPCSFNDGLCIR